MNATSPRRYLSPFVTALSLATLLVCYSPQAEAQSRRDGVVVVDTADTILNTYAVLALDAAAGSDHIAVTNVADLAGPAGVYSRIDLGAGDLLLIMQMQGAVIDTSDTVAFGEVLDLAGAGNYELAHVLSVSGDVITLDLANKPGGLAFSYRADANTQVVRVPQPSALTVSAGASVVAPPWDGQRGGIVALSVQGHVQLDGRIDVSGRGFRGGAQPNVSDAAANYIGGYRSTNPVFGGGQGEGIAGGHSLYLTLGAGFGRGAPANGGGGGNSHNAGGGGGANGNNGNPWTGQGIMDNHPGWLLDPQVISNDNQRHDSSGGGRGGYSYGQNDRDALTVPPGDPLWGGNFRYEVGGLGGRPLDNDPLSRLFMGGGGGAGDANNAASGVGGNGGGIVLVQALSLGGTGEIRANGAAGSNTFGTHNDAPSGGGGGGAIYLGTHQLAGIAAYATGGKGGDQSTPTGNAFESEGPGGGGGGGFIAFQGGSIIADFNNGIGGLTASRALTEWPGNGTSHGATGDGDPDAVLCAALAYCPFMGFIAITNPNDGEVTTDNTPTLSGTGDPDAVITLFVDGVPVGNTTVAADGTWTFAIPSTLADGPHTLTASVVDAFGYTGDDAIAITVDATTYVSLLTPTDGQALQSLTQVTGTAEAGATVVVTIDGTVVGTTTADASGNWSLPVTAALSEGEHSLIATATDAAGNTAQDTVSFTIDTSTSVAISTPTDGQALQSLTQVTGTAEAGATVVVTIDGTVVGTTTADASGNWSLPVTAALSEGEHSLIATATDAAGNTAQDTVSFTIDTSTSVAISTPTDGQALQSLTQVTGTAEPGATVVVTIDGTVVGTTTADQDGNWTLTLDAPLDDGNHSLTATATDAAGNTAQATVTFTVDSHTSAAVTITAPLDGSTVTGVTELSGTAEPGATVVITIDGTVVGTTTADQDGNWTLTLDAPLDDGNHSLTATATDAAGNTAQATVTFTVDSHTSTAVTITAPLDGSTVTGVTELSGTAEPGATVVITIDGVVVGTTTADQDGNWSFTLDAPLGEGTHSVTVTATDSQGESSQVSISFTIDPVDSDGDTIPDAVDNCPNVSNPDQADSNGDGIGDACSTEICNNGVDDTGNGLSDCEDPACASHPSCRVHEICGSGRDEDGDTLIDCADPDCAFAAICQPKVEICDNGLDDSGNGLSDCDDPACASHPTCQDIEPPTGYALQGGECACTTVHQPTSRGPLASMLLVGLAFLWWRRRRTHPTLPST